MKTTSSKLLLLHIAMAIVLITIEAFSQVPEKMSYQAIVRNSEGELVADHQVGMRIHIKQGSQFGASVYVETQAPIANERGMISLEIGNGTKVLGTFAGIDWSAGPYFLYTEIDPSGGDEYCIFALSQLLSVPFAFYAETADSVPGAATKEYVDRLRTQLTELQVLAGIGIKDIDGNFYRTVQIGDQTWIKENLKTTRFNDGTPIQLVSDNAEWSGLNSSGYCWYKNDEKKYKNPFGALYNWYAVNTGKLCPSGWHVPTKIDIDLLLATLGPDQTGDKLKESGAKHWDQANIDATNESGFTALASGIRKESGIFEGFRGSFYMWINTIEENQHADLMILGAYSSSATIENYFWDLNCGLSVRCLKD